MRVFELIRGKGFPLEPIEVEAEFYSLDLLNRQVIVNFGHKIGTKVLPAMESPFGTRSEAEVDRTEPLASYTVGKNWSVKEKVGNALHEAEEIFRKAMTE